jgi:hypothetical protein
VIELLVLGALGFVALIVVGVLASVASMVWWLVALPFTLLRWTFKLLAALFLLPFLLLFGLIGGVLFGGGALLLFLIPALPFIAIGALIWALVRRRRPIHATS